MYADVEELQECGDEKLEEKANDLKKFMTGAQIAKLGKQSDAEKAIQNYIDGDSGEARKL